MIYLDNASTTQIDDRVYNAMVPYLKEQYGNPGSVHDLGAAAATAVSKARDILANEIHAGRSRDIIFTSGGSEANSMAILGIADALRSKGFKHIVASATEHHSVMKALGILEKKGFYLSYVKPDKYGVIRAESVINEFRDETGLCCIMYVNNETGSINEVDEICKACDERGIYTLIDCVQALGNVDINVSKMCCDFASFSSHKIHGPKGVGALYVRMNDPTMMSPLICGGNEQEFGVRGGTENVAGIVGFGEALLHMDRQSFLRNRKSKLFTDILYKKLTELKIINKVCPFINGSIYDKIDKIVSYSFRGIDGETLLMLLNRRGVYVSAGSACNSREQVPSYVLTAMGLSEERARSTIRVSFSRMTTEEDIVNGAAAVAECVYDLYRIGCHNDDQGN